MTRGAGAHASTAAQAAAGDAGPTTEQATPAVEADTRCGDPRRGVATQTGQEPAPVPVGQAAKESETVDPRYEDMWASTETRPVDIPDLSSLDIDFDDEKE